MKQSLQRFLLFAHRFSKHFWNVYIEYDAKTRLMNTFRGKMLASKSQLVFRSVSFAHVTTLISVPEVCQNIFYFFISSCVKVLYLYEFMSKNMCLHYWWLNPRSVAFWVRLIRLPTALSFLPLTTASSQMLMFISDAWGTEYQSI